MKSFKKIIESVRLSEKLSKSDPIDKWISDFVHSDDPKFDGKSKEERMKMAQGAYYGMQEEVDLDEDKAHIEQHLADKDINALVSGKTVKVHSSDVAATKKHLTKAGYGHKVVGGLNEDIEELEESSNEKLSNYVLRSFAAGNELHNQIKTETDPEKKAKLQAKLSQRNTGVIKAAKKMKNEETELDETANIKVGSHVTLHPQMRGGKEVPNCVPVKEAFGATASNRTHEGSFQEKQHGKHFTYKKTNDAWAKKHNLPHEIDVHDGVRYGHVKGTVAHIATDENPNGSPKLDKWKLKNHKKWMKESRTTDIVREAYLKAKSKKKNEEKEFVGLNDFLEAVNVVKRDANGKVISWSHEGDWEKSKKPKDGRGKAANLSALARRKTEKLTKEEVDNLVEKDEREYGYEGEMVMTQLKTLCRHAEHLMGMLKPDTDLPEWVQSKITLATDYMQTSHDYLMSEMNEEVELNELDPKTLASYALKNHNQLMRHTASVNMKYGRGDADAQDYDLKHSRKADNRSKGLTRALSKLAKEEVEELDEKKGLWDNIHAKRKRIEAGSGEKMRKPGTEGAPTDQDFKNASEETEYQKKEKDAVDLKLLKWKNQQRAEKALKEEETMLTYKDFLETISESRIDDIKDRLAAAREKRLNAYDFSKEKEKPKSNVTRHYAKYNDETDSNDEPETPKEKRGRGRPAGSKSGARV
jgi:hypothetical protein